MKENKKGFSLAEILVSIGIMVMIIMGSLAFITYISKETRNTKDKATAILKANQILSEIRNYVDSNKEAVNLKYLDNFNDAGPNILLTIENVADPSQAPSDNIRIGNNFKYARQIRVYPLPNSPQSDKIRVVEVRMYKWNQNRNSWEYLTSATTVINTMATFSTPKQAYEIYFLSIGTIPGWWVHTPAIREVVDGIISDLESRNPGLDIAPHWITVMSYGGRDPFYRPFIGERVGNTGGDPLPTDFIYYYPGTSFINNNPALPFKYYTNFLMMGNVWYKDENSQPQKKRLYEFSLADQYNHCVRYPEELENYERLKQYAIANNLPIPEISYRMLIEKLYSDPSFQNAIIINLHGELMPIPPLRNESDPAKLPYIDPATYLQLSPGYQTRYQNIRVAVHPEQIAYPTNNITLRVYAYQLDPNANLLPNNRLEYITLLIGPMQQNSYTVTLKAIEGGVPPLSNSYSSNLGTINVSFSEASWQFNANPNTMKALLKMISYENQKYIMIRLQNTPTKCPQINTGQGLPTSQRVYGLEYIPFMFPFGGSAQFRELTDSTNNPKNTARWVITINNVEQTTDINKPLKIVYTIDPPATNQPNQNSHIYSDPQNYLDKLPPYAQKTYVWVGKTLDQIPITEQFQILGDPRLCPYRDVVQQGKYNMFFAFPNNVDFNTIRQQYFNNNSLFNGWIGSSAGISANVAGGFYVIREALARSHSIFNSITGFSFYYISFGQEIGGDEANNLPQGVPVPASIFQNSNGTLNGEQSITDFGGTAEAGQGPKNIVRISGSWGAWGNFALPFMGEIFPDDLYLYWKDNGNLPNNQFKKRRWKDSLSLRFQYNREVRTAPSGCSSFFNASPLPNVNQWFNHGWGNTQLNSTKANLTNDLERAFNITLPQRIPSARPWDIDLNFQGQPPEWNVPFFVSNRFLNSIYKIYYNHDVRPNGADVASGIVRSVKQNNPTGLYYWAVVNGLSPQGSEAQSFIAKYSITSSIYAFLLAGFDNNANITTPPPQLPVITITNPENTQEITSNTTNIQYNIQFTRWDGNNYIQNQPNIPQNPNNWRYLIKYQPLGDNKWYFIQDTQRAFPTKLGERNENYFINTTSFNADLSNIPNGMYWLLVEAHHLTRKHHFSYHMVFININK